MALEQLICPIGKPAVSKIFIDKAASLEAHPWRWEIRGWQLWDLKDGSHILIRKLRHHEVDCPNSTAPIRGMDELELTLHIIELPENKLELRTVSSKFLDIGMLSAESTLAHPSMSDNMVEARRLFENRNITRIQEQTVWMNCLLEQIITYVKGDF